MSAARDPIELPDLEIEGRVGEGAMGVVYRARQKSLDRMVAVKVLRPDLARDREYVERLGREARAVASLDHPHLVRAILAGEEGESHYFVMELVDGESAADAARGDGLPVERATEIGVAVGEALAYAHERDLVHRDVKPSNVLLGKDGSIKLADLGLSKRVVDPEETLSRPGTTVGTPAYMAPEQTRDASGVGPAADVYALAATIAYCVTGKPPFEQSTFLEMLGAKEAAPPPLDGLPASLAETIRRGLDPDPSHRPSASELARLLSEESSDAGPTPRGRQERTSRTWVAALLLLTAGVAYLVSTRAGIEPSLPDPTPPPAETEPSPAAAPQPREFAPIPDPDKAILVLPFENLSADPENAYFAAGVHGDILTNLGGLEDLAVLSRSTALGVAKERMSAREIAEQLDVTHLMEGSVRRSGDRVRIAVQLIDAARDEQLWAASYDRELLDIFAVQTEVALEVARELETELSPEAAAVLVAPATSSMKAYQLVLQAAHRVEEPRSVELLERAIELDPEYAQAHEYLALALASHSSPRDTAARDRATRAAQRAIDLSDGVHGWNAMARVANVWGVASLDERLAMVERHLAVRPSHAPARLIYAELLFQAGYLHESLAQSRYALRLAPRVPVIAVSLVVRLIQAGRDEEALELAIETAAAHPDSEFVEFAYAHALLRSDPVAALRPVLERVHRSRHAPAAQQIAEYLLHLGAVPEAGAWVRVFGATKLAFAVSPVNERALKLAEAALLDPPLTPMSDGALAPLDEARRIAEQGDVERGRALLEHWLSSRTFQPAIKNKFWEWLHVGRARLLADTGRMEEAMPVLREVEESLEPRRDSPALFLTGVIRAMHGDLRGALVAFEESAATGRLLLIHHHNYGLLTDPFGIYHGLSEDPRYRAFIQRMKENMASNRALLRAELGDLLDPPTLQVREPEG